MTDLIDRFSGESLPNRPKINSHRWIGAQRLYAANEFSRQDLITEFDMTGQTDELRQAGQLADNIDNLFSVNEYTLNASQLTWTNQPATLQELLNVTHRRSVLNFAQVGQIRMLTRIATAGAVGAVLFIQYSTNETDWNILTSNQIDVGSTGTKVTAWENIPTGAKSGDVFVRIVGQNGNNNADPQFGTISLQVKSFMDRLIYISLVEGIIYSIEDDDDRLYHNQDATVNKIKVFEDMRIVG